jgi:nitrite transporter NirC
MYTETVHAVGDQAAAKRDAQRRSLVSHFARSMLAGMYVGASIVLIFTIGGSLTGPAAEFRRLLMGVCFGGALTLVIFAGSELFTGSTMVFPLGVLTRKVSLTELLMNWGWTWLGNLAGSALVAVLVVRSGLLDAEKFADINAFVLKLVETKMNLPFEQLLWRSVLANWLVCLGVWMSAKVKSEPARIMLIFWCMFMFITSGFEHSIANMTGLLLGLLVPHPDTISWTGYAYNLGVTTLGNTIGGAVIVAGMYWIGSPFARVKAKERPVVEETEMELLNQAPTPAGLSGR